MLLSVAAHVGDIRNTYRIVVEVSERRRPPRQGQVHATEMGLREIRLEVSNLTGFLLSRFILLKGFCDHCNELSHFLI